MPPGALSTAHLCVHFCHGGQGSGHLGLRPLVRPHCLPQQCCPRSEDLAPRSSGTQLRPGDTVGFSLLCPGVEPSPPTNHPSSCPFGWGSNQLPGSSPETPGGQLTVELSHRRWKHKTGLSRARPGPLRGLCSLPSLPRCRPGHPPPVAPSGVLRTGWGAPDLCCCTAPLTDLGPRTVPRMPQDPGQFPLPLRLPLQVACLPGTHSLNTMPRTEKCQE